jgi:hypothetical protein
MKLRRPPLSIGKVSVPTSRPPGNWNGCPAPTLRAASRSTAACCPSYGPSITQSTRSTCVRIPKALPRCSSTSRELAVHRYGDGNFPFGTTRQRAPLSTKFPVLAKREIRSWFGASYETLTSVAKRSSPASKRATLCEPIGLAGNVHHLLEVPMTARFRSSGTLVLFCAFTSTDVSRQLRAAPAGGEATVALPIQIPAPSTEAQRAARRIPYSRVFECRAHLVGPMTPPRGMSDGSCTDFHPNFTGSTDKSDAAVASRRLW